MKRWSAKQCGVLALLLICAGCGTGAEERERSRGIGLFCDPGAVVVNDCTAASPCTWALNGQQYTKGDMCHPQIEGELCSPGIVWDCWWRTTPEPAGSDSLRCQCWPT